MAGHEFPFYPHEQIYSEVKIILRQQVFDILNSFDPWLELSIWNFCLVQIAATILSFSSSPFSQTTCQKRDVIIKQNVNWSSVVARMRDREVWSQHWRVSIYSAQKSMTIPALIFSILWRPCWYFVLKVQCITCLFFVLVDRGLTLLFPAQFRRSFSYKELKTTIKKGQQDSFPHGPVIVRRSDAVLTYFVESPVPRFRGDCARRRTWLGERWVSVN